MEPTTLAYIAGFLDGDGSIFFQIVRRKDYVNKFQIRCSIAFYQKTDSVHILRWLKSIFKSGSIRHRKTGISDYTVVGSSEVKRILTLLGPYVQVKKKQLRLGLEILEKLDTKSSYNDFILICKLVDKFGDLNYSKKRMLTTEVVRAYFQH